MSSTSLAPSTTARPARRSDRRTAVLLALLGASSLAFLYWAPSLARPAIRGPVPGEPVAVAIDWDDAEQMLIPIPGHPYFTVPAETHVRIISKGLRIFQVEIADGPEKGRIGWIPEAWLTADPSAAMWAAAQQMGLAK